MSETAILVLIVALDVALLGLLAFAMTLPRRLTPHEHHLARPVRLDRRSELESERESSQQSESSGQSATSERLPIAA